MTDEHVPAPLAPAPQPLAPAPAPAALPAPSTAGELWPAAPRGLPRATEPWPGVPRGLPDTPAPLPEVPRGLPRAAEPWPGVPQGLPDAQAPEPRELPTVPERQPLAPPPPDSSPIDADDVHRDSAVPEVDTVGQATTPSDEQEPAARKARHAAPAAKSRRGGRSTDRQVARRAGALAVKLARQDETQLAPLAAALSLPPSAAVAEIAAVAVTASAKDLQPLSDFEQVIGADPLEAGVVAAALGRARLKAVWRLVSTLGLIGAEMPSSDAKAAIALVRAVHDHGIEDTRRCLGASLELIGR